MRLRPSWIAAAALLAAVLAPSIVQADVYDWRLDDKVGAERWAKISSDPKGESSMSVAMALSWAKQQMAAGKVGKASFGGLRQLEKGAEAIKKDIDRRSKILGDDHAEVLGNLEDGLKKLGVGLEATQVRGKWEGGANKVFAKALKGLSKKKAKGAKSSEVIIAYVFNKAAKSFHVFGLVRKGKKKVAFDPYTGQISSKNSKTVAKYLGNKYAAYKRFLFFKVGTGEGEALPDENVDLEYPKYNKIVIRYNPSKDPYFAKNVIAMLDLIDSKPVGHALLRAIQRARPKKKAGGFHVRIVANERVVDLRDKEKMRKGIAWTKGNTTYVCDATHSALKNGRPGKGSNSWLKTNTVISKTPDGRRPPFIGFAHELIHCYHNLYGTARSRGPGNVENTRDDEAMTVGFALDPAKRPHQRTDYSGEEICENKIRAEHRIRLRETYTGVLDDRRP